MLYSVTKQHNADMYIILAIFLPILLLLAWKNAQQYGAWIFPVSRHYGQEIIHYFITNISAILLFHKLFWEFIEYMFKQIFNQYWYFRWMFGTKSPIQSIFIWYYNGYTYFKQRKKWKMSQADIKPIIIYKNQS